MSVNWKDITARAAWTFAEAFSAVLLLAIGAQGTAINWQVALYAAALAGVAAVLSLIKGLAKYALGR